MKQTISRQANLKRRVGYMQEEEDIQERRPKKVNMGDMNTN